jgi:hypothetical protein
MDLRRAPRKSFCPRVAKGAISCGAKLMKKFLAVLVLCLPALGQTEYSGAGTYSGAAQFLQVTAGPLTYPSAITNWCELGTETNCPGATQTPYLGCNYWANGTYTPGAAPWTAGSYALNATVSLGGNVYLSLEAGNSTEPPGSEWQNLGACGAVTSVGGLTGAGNIVTQPFYGTQIVRITDYNTQSGLCTGNPSYNPGDIAPDASKLLVIPVSGEGCIFAFNPATMAATATPIQGFVTGDSCLTNCVNFADGAQYAWSYTNPNLIWEELPSPPSINQIVIQACAVPVGTGSCVPGGSTSSNVAPTFANAANWIFNRTVIMNPLAPPGCGGCAPIPSDFAATYMGIAAVDFYDTAVSFVMSDDGQNNPMFGAGPTLTSISGNGTVVSVGNNAKTGWAPVVGSPVVISGFTTTTAYNSATGTPWTVCGTDSGCTNPTSTAFQYLSTVTGTGGISSATASYPSKTCPTPSGADPINFAGYYGPIYIMNVSIGKGPGGDVGWRLYDVCDGWITGNFGDSSASIWPNEAAPTEGNCSAGTAPPCDSADLTQYPVGESGGTALPDRFYLHEATNSLNPLYSSLSVASGESINNPGSCSGTVCSDTETAWETATTNIRIVPEPEGSGHSELTFDDFIVGHQTIAFEFHNATEPDAVIFPVALTEIDQHSTHRNQGSQDWQPQISYPQNVCDITGTPGSSPTDACPPYYNVGAWQNEVVAIENSVGNGPGGIYPNAANAYGKHCTYTIGGTPTASSCAYRLAQTYNTGTNFDFSSQNATTTISPNGQFVVFTSDWNLTLGCTNGWTGGSGQACLDPVSAANTTGGTISATAADGAGHATITATNPTTFVVGMYAAITGTAESCLNHHVLITSTTGTAFTGNLVGGTCSSFSNASDTGTANWPGCGNASLPNSACPRNDVFVVDLLSAN